VTPSPENLIEFDDVSKTFPGQRALKHVSFAIDRREIHALVGENGSGKSTLIKALAGFHLPDPGGRILVDGAELRAGSAFEARRLGLRFVHQDLGLVGELNAIENVGLASGFTTRSGRISWRRQRRHTTELLARIGVELDIRCPVSRLRPVERTAIAIARALDETHSTIRLLVLDEPTAALPPAESAALFGVIGEVIERGVSVLYVSHRLDEILDLAQRVTVLRDGECKGTFAVSEMSRGRLIELIIGQEIEPERPSSTRPPATAADEPVLRVRGLRSEQLRGVDFDLAPGEVLGIAGLTGSGREELASALCGGIPAALTLTERSGREWKSVTPALAKRLGLVLVLPNRHPASAIGQFSIRENVTLPTLGKHTTGIRISRAQERRTVADWIGRLDIRPRDAERLYTYLSGGNKQKVILAKWLNLGPNIIAMDDPTSGVDIGARQAIYRLVRDLAGTGTAFVICSSDLEDFVGVCDRVLALVSGRVANELHADEIQEGALLNAIAASATSDAPARDPGESP
jgi:ribose transport system ATP-binding protein